MELAKARPATNRTIRRAAPTAAAMVLLRLFGRVRASEPMVMYRQGAAETHMGRVIYCVISGCEGPPLPADDRRLRSE